MNMKLAGYLISITVLTVTPVHVQSGAGTVGTPIGEKAAGAARAGDNSGAVGLGRGHMKEDEDEALGRDSTSNEGFRRSNADNESSSSDERSGSSRSRRNPAIDPTRAW